MAARQEETQRRRSRTGAWLVLFALGASVGLGCELFSLDRAKLYDDVFDSGAIDVKPPPKEAAPKPEPEGDAEADAEATDASTEAAPPTVDAGTDTGTPVVDAGSDTATGTDAADASAD